MPRYRKNLLFRDFPIAQVCARFGFPGSGPRSGGGYGWAGLKKGRRTHPQRGAGLLLPVKHPLFLRE